jgi:prepilin-type N-terminal cleavage/methylation domain-containing protein
MKLSLIQVSLLRRENKRDDRGFTLTEVLVVIIIAGLLASIAAPSWLSFVDRQRMTSVRSELLLKVKEAQAKSLRTKTLQSVVVAIDNPSTGRPTSTVSVVQSSRNAAGDLVVGTEDPGKKMLGGENSSAFVLEVFPPNTTLTFNYGGTVEYPKTSLLSLVTSPNNTSSLMMYRFKPRKNSTNMSACLVVDTIIGAIREATDDDCK